MILIKFVLEVSMFSKKILLTLLLVNSFIFGNIYIESDRLENKIKIDGNLDKIVWKQAPGYSNFLTFRPNYGKELSEETIAYTAYDSKILYFAFKCYCNDPDKIQVNMAKRNNIFYEDWVYFYA